MIVVDDRWTGQNGIGRYANALIPLISVPLTPIGHSGSPSAPTDFLMKRLSVGGVVPQAVYSPGYNGFLRNIPQTITVLDLIHLASPGSAKYRPYYDLFLRPLIKRNGHVVTISETSKRHIEEWLATPSVTVINAGIGSSSDFTPEGARHESARPYFVYVGNLRSHKNVETIVEAIGLLPDFDLVIVASDRSGVEQLAQRHGVSSQVIVRSGIDDPELAALYRGARATLQPSILEGFGLPALESALCGTPVLYFHGCESVREICADGGIAISVATDAREWADAMGGVAEGQRFGAGTIGPDTYSWDATARIVSETLSRYL